MMMVLDIFGKGEKHEQYDLVEPLFINKQWFNEVDIWQHYKESHSYMTDEMILGFVDQLHKTDYPVDEIGHQRNSDNKAWKTYEHIFYINKKAYLLAWMIKEQNETLYIIHCYRRHKYDKK